MRAAVKKVAFGLAAIVVVFGAIFAVGYARQNGAKTAQPIPPAPLVRARPIQVEDHEFTETFYGQVAPWQRVRLRFEQAGTVAWIRKPDGAAIPEGQLVAAGDRVMMLDPATAQADLASAAARFDAALAAAGISGSPAVPVKADPTTLDAALAEAAQSDAVIKEAQANLLRASDDFERIKRLFDPDPAKSRASQVEMNRATSDLERSRAQLASAERNFDERSKAAHVALADLRQAQVRFDKTILASPVDGYVTDVPPEVGETVSPADVCVELMVLSKVKAIVGVVDSRVARLREGQAVNLTVESLDRALRLASLGVNEREGDGGASADGSLSVEERAELARELARPWRGTVLRVPKRADPAGSLFNVEIAVANRMVRHGGQAYPLLRPGMIVRADVVVDVAAVFKIPQSATVLDRDGVAAYFVWPTAPAGFSLAGLLERRVDLPVVSARRVAIDRDKALLVAGCYMLPGVPGQGGEAGPATQPDAAVAPLVIVAGQHKLTDGVPVRLAPQELPEKKEGTTDEHR